MLWIALAVNPEPWKVGAASVGYNGKRPYPRISPDPQLVAYQEALREAAGEWIARNHLSMKLLMDQEYNKISFWYWRQLAVYQGPSRRVTKHKVDVTNLNKATEDALQSIFYDNDVTNRVVVGQMVEQSVHIKTGIVLICLEQVTQDDILATIPWEAWRLIKGEEVRLAPVSQAISNKPDPTEVF